jgi:hypothetical protein
MYCHLLDCTLQTMCCCERFVTTHEFDGSFLFCTRRQHITSKPAKCLVIIHPLLCILDQLVNKL